VPVLSAIFVNHLRPWSTVLRVPTGAGLLYFKAVAPVLGHAPGLTAALARWRPDCMPEVLAADPARGWLLMRDSGTPLRALIREDGNLQRWHNVLPLFAQVQIEMAGRLDELLALGALDRRLALLPAEYERLLADTDSLLLDQLDGLSRVGYQRLLSLAPHFAAECQRLAEFGLPETLHHDDFHDGNIFMRGDRCTFIDWGESCGGQPFFTTVVMLRSAAHTLGLPAGAPEVLALRDCYLEPWQQLALRSTLLEALNLAQRLGMVCRALTWHRVVTSLEEPFRAENAEAVPGWLGEFLEATATAQDGDIL
jgi:Phosphotransferase enzyme family